MESMNEEKNIIERNEMFSSSESMTQKLQKLADQSGLVEHAISIPDSGGQTLVHYNTTAYLERKEKSGVVMIPIQLTVSSQGKNLLERFFVCSE